MVESAEGLELPKILKFRHQKEEHFSLLPSEMNKNDSEIVKLQLL